ncbi:efflux RND transporter permease subunit [Defluviitalea raffinosedens]|uniref:efflux RND transporter permease subunit n=1 Tax=Defluviitalea raffinosedens TaxID=1450156 RepID=UPI00195E9BE4|nr:efflux RND transporter permease subunit [Defluviitalea raffinosedens]MBM7685416.1 HAE1 family hydrophobic/amphiphilic exporter-1 [Defluviitalea raffinosedens]
MKLSKVSIQRPVTTVMVVFIVILLGIVSIGRLPVDLLPSFELPYALVMTSYNGAGPQEIESLITKPLEATVGTVSNLKNITSTSSNGSSMIFVEFNDGTDMDVAMLNMREKIDMIKDFLPEDAEDPMVMALDPNMMPIMEIGISGNEDLVKLKQIVEDEITGKIERIEGVASVSLSGGKEKEIRITLLPDKLKGYNISPSTVAQSIAAENLNLPAGTVKQGNSTLTLRAVGEFDSIEEIRNLPIMTSGGVIYLRDIAEVEEVFKEMSSYAYINGQPSISLSIQKQSTANTVQVSKAINKTLEQVRTELKDIEITTIYDSAEFINSSIGNVASTAISGGILAVLILFVFLRNIRSTFIVGTAIPVSIVATFALMYFSGLTLNMVSLGGLALGIGMLVDNAIVVLENIYRHRENGEGRKDAADKGTTEVGMAVLASTLTTIAVFLPIVFVEGITAKLFKEMALTITYSLTASLVVAVTLVPMMASKILKVEKVDEIKRRKITTKIFDAWSAVLDSIDKVYRRVLNWTLHHRLKASLITIGVFIATLSIPVLGLVGMEFFPASDEGSFTIDVTLPKGTVIEETFEVVQQVEAKLEGIKEVQEVFVTIGGGGMLSSGTSSNSASLTVDIGSVKERERSVDEVADEVRVLVSDIPGAEFSVSGSSSMTVTGGSPISIEIAGDDLEKLKQIANDVVDIVESVEGTREVTSSFEDGIPEAQITINRQKASMYGLNMATISNTLKTAVQGSVATRFKVDGTEIDVRMVYDTSRSEYLKDIKNIAVTSPMGVNVPLSEVADISISESPTSIYRENQKRVVTVSSALFGVDMSTAQTAIDQRLKEYPMPDGYTYKFSGEVEQMMESFSSLGLALLLAILLVYMVLAAQFESFLHPFTIMFSVPLALTGAILGLFVTGRTLSMPSFIGLIMLVGIVVNNAIVLIDYIIQLRKRGYDRTEAILEAGPTRLRPILMTTLTTVLGMLPMALGIGEGAETMAPLATAVIGGLSLSTILTLVVIPLNYTLFDDISRKLRGKRKKKKSQEMAV